MSTNVMEKQDKRRSHGMQFVAKMTQSGEYFFLRIPRERNEQAKRYFENKKHLLVTFHEVEVDDN